jgi:hypothetical protein
MQVELKKIAIVSILSLLIMVFGIDTPKVNLGGQKSLTDQDIKDEILKDVEKGKLPSFDISEVSIERITKAYADVLNDLSDGKITLDGKHNLYNKIREKGRGKGHQILPSENTEYEIEN